MMKAVTMAPLKVYFLAILALFTLMCHCHGVTRPGPLSSLQLEPDIDWSFPLFLPEDLLLLLQPRRPYYIL